MAPGLVIPRALLVAAVLCALAATALACDYGRGRACSWCWSCIDCPVGKYSDSDSRYSTCKDCNINQNQYQDQTRQRNCKTLTCNAGYVQKDVISDTCLACETGKYWVNQKCQPCSTGTYTDTVAQTQCSTVNDCPVGTSVLSEPTLSSDRQCDPCPLGFFQDDINQPACKGVQECEFGIAVAATTSTDNQCIDCPADSYYDSAANQCKPITLCPFGQGQTAPPTLTSNRQCATCQAGVTYSDEVSDAPCKPVTPCPVGTKFAFAATIQSNTVCTNCVDGVTYQNEIGQTTCKPVTPCDAADRIITYATKSNDYTCKAQRTCVPANDLTCTCPDSCTQCTVQPSPPVSNAALVLQNQIPAVTKTISCSAVTGANTAALTTACFDLCDASTECSSFSLELGTNTCCLRSFYRIDTPRSAPNTLYIELATCDTCAPGNVVAPRGCRAVDTNPEWTTAPPASLTIPANLPGNTQLFSVAATTFREPITYSLEVSGAQAKRFAVSTNGVVSLESPLNGGGTVRLILTAFDAGQTCQLDGQESVNAPCSISAETVITVPVFVGCPSSSSVYVQSASATHQFSWTAPYIPTQFDGHYQNLREVNSLTSPVTRGANTETVLTYKTDAIFNGVGLICTFTLRVILGAELQVTSIGHVFSPPYLMDLLIDNDGSSGGGGFTGILQGDIFGQGLVIGVTSPAGRPFTLSVPAQYEVRFIMDLRWCTDGMFPEASALPEQSKEYVDAEASWVSSNAPDVQLTVQAFFTQDGRCLAVSTQGPDMTPGEADNIAFSTVNVVLDGGAILRRRRALGDDLRYLPVSPSAMAMQYTITDGSTVDPGPFLTLEDTSAPQWIDCPLDQEVAAGSGVASVQATWVEPTPIDNVAVVSWTRSAAPGSLFTVTGSPHHVVYEAFDSRQSSKCSFRVFVTFPASPYQVNVALDGLFPTLSSPVPELPMHYLSQHVFDTTTDVSSTQPLSLAMDWPNVNQLVLVFTPPNGDNIVVKPRPNALFAQIDLDLTWTTDGTVPVNKPAQDVLISFVLTRYSSSEDPVDTPFRDEAFSFSYSSAVLDPASGIVHLQATSAKLPSKIQFATLKVIVSFPDGRSAQAANYLLVSSSKLSVTYRYDRILSAAEVALEDQFLTVEDSEPPKFDSTLDDVVVQTATGKDYAIVSWTTPTATDNRGNPVITANYPSGSKFYLSGSPYNVVITATDSFGNTDEISFTVTVEDKEPPFVRCSSTTIHSLPPTSSTVSVTKASWGPSQLTDNSGIVPTIVTPSGNLVLGVGSHTVNLLVQDQAGLQSSCSKTVRVIDTVKPTIVCPALEPVPQDNDITGTVVRWSDPEVTDNDVSIGSVTGTHSSGDKFDVGETNVTLSVADRSGNTASCTFPVNVEASKIPPTAAPAAGSSATLGAAAGGGVLLVVLLIVAVLIHRVRMRHLRPTDFNSILQYMDQVQNSPDGVRLPREIKRTAVRVLTELGQGAFGIVAKAMLQESPAIPGYLVAVKQLHESAAAADRTELLEEAAVMAQFQHENVVALVGVVTVGQPIMVILEFMEYGSLHALLKSRQLSDAQQKSFAFDCAAGLYHIHSKGFVHRDVAARNVLVSSEMRGKIADFGLARDSDNNSYYRSRGGQLPVRWTAPEALDDRKFNEATDVWSYGVLLYEIWTRAETPYQGWTNNKVWVEVQSGYRLPQPENCPDEVYRLMNLAWDADPGSRPPFSFFQKQFEDMLPSGPGDKDGYLDVGDEEETGGDQFYNNVAEDGLQDFDEDDEQDSDDLPGAVKQPTGKGHLTPKAASASAAASDLYDMGANDEPEDPKEHPAFRNVAYKESKQPKQPESSEALYDMGVEDPADKAAEEQPQAKPTSAQAKPAQPIKLSATYDIGSATTFEVGMRVEVAGYTCQGTVRFVGNHQVDGKPRVGVELDEPVGLNNGTVRDYAYFTCAPKHGVLVVPQKLKPAE